MTPPPDFTRGLPCGCTYDTRIGDFSRRCARHEADHLRRQALYKAGARPLPEPPGPLERRYTIAEMKESARIYHRRLAEQIGLEWGPADDARSDAMVDRLLAALEGDPMG
jgi:hypothetical protein